MGGQQDKVGGQKNKVGGQKNKVGGQKNKGGSKKQGGGSKKQGAQNCTWYILISWVESVVFIDLFLWNHPLGSSP